MNETLYLEQIERDCFQRHCRLSNILSSHRIHIFDVGANIGQSIKHYRNEFPNCRITSFEPNPEVFPLLEQNWGGLSGITLNQVALSNCNENVTFHATRVSEASSLLKPTNHMMALSAESKYDHKEIQVPSMTLDHYCQINNIGNIDILKLDVQGSELSVLHGAEKLLSEGKITSIYSEVTFAETYINQTRFVDLLTYLNSFYYDIWDIGSFLYTRNEKIWAANLTFLHESAAKRIENKRNQAEERQNGTG